MNGWFRLPADTPSARDVLRQMLEGTIAAAVAEARTLLEADTELSLSDAEIEAALAIFERKVRVLRESQLEAVLRRCIH
jgi:hypothetical protein